jgi:hypothetical protein
MNAPMIIRSATGKNSMSYYYVQVTDDGWVKGDEQQ